MSAHNSYTQTNPNDCTALMPITERPTPVMVRGAGSWLWDSNGDSYLDLVQGWAVNALGHCPPQLVEALTLQAATLITPSPAFHNAPQLALAQRLTELSQLAQVHFSNSGAEANEVAIKLARKWGQKHKKLGNTIITTNNGFHGRTLSTMAASGKPGWDDLFAPAMQGFKKVPYGDIAAMRKAIDKHTLAMMVEPIQGEAGVIVPADDYLPALRELADQHQVLLILDEIQTGVGRCGSFFAYQSTPIVPDIVTLGKGLGGGVPISATLASKSVCCFQHGDQGGTYNGNPLVTAAALAIVNTVAEEDFMRKANRAGSYFAQSLQTIADRFGLQEVRGRGLLWAVELASANAKNIQSRAMALGLLINAPRPATIRLMPALNIGHGEIDSAMQLLCRAIGQVR